MGGDAVAVVVGGGPAPHPLVAERLPPDPLVVVAADSGLDHAEALGLPVDVVVGDLDSVSPAALARARAQGVPIEQHPPDKDATDLELALARAASAGAGAVVVVAGDGGRLDHALAEILALAAGDLAQLRVEAWIGRAWLAVVRPGAPLTLAGAPGDLLSLLPVGGPAEGITTTGLRYPLAGEALDPGSARGLSNELAGPEATVSLTAGTLLAVRPEALAPDPATAAAPPPA